MNKITIEDVAKIKFGNGIKLSPSGEKACFVVTESDLKTNDYKHNIHCVDLKTGKHTQFTQDGKEDNFLFDDENTLLFSTSRSKEDDAEPFYEKTTFYRLPLDGGEAKVAFSIDKNVVSIDKASDGFYVVKALVDWNAPDPTKLSKEECEEEKDYHIFEEVPFWGNGRGFISGKRIALFTYDEKTETLLRITGKYTDVASCAIGEGKLAYVARTYKDIIPMVTSLNLYDFKTKKTKTVVKQGKLRVGPIAFTGEDLFYLASDLKPWGDGQLSDYYRYRLTTGKNEMVRKNIEELAICDSTLSDTFYGGGTRFKAVGDKVYFMAMKKFANSIYSFDAQNKLTKICDFDGSIGCFDTNQKNLVFIGGETDGLNKVFKKSGKSYKEIFDINEGFLKDKYVAKAEYIPFTNSNGDELDGWVLKPINYNPKKKYPGILEIHGGPRCAYGTAFFHEMQVFASNGYFVFFTNPRGSEGYGEAFADLRGKYGTIDFQDLMEFTDHVLKKFKQIDPKHIGASGGSYGGFMCNWIEGNTDRFSAIASQRSVSNWVADFGSSEIGVTFDSNEMGATPWTDMEKMWDQSPLKYACNAKTPILFIHSLCDYNCPLEQGIEFFTAMKYFGVPSKMVIFEKENHNLSRSGKPKHRIRRLKEINAWFDQYLK